MVCASEEQTSTAFHLMTNANASELNLEQLQQVSGGAAANYDFCIDPWVLIWKLNNPGKDLPPFLGGSRSKQSPSF